MKKKIIFSVVLFVFCLSAMPLVHAQDLGNIDKKTPVKLHGSLGAQGIYYHMNGGQNRRQPFSYVLMGNLSMDILGLVQIPVSFTYSEQERNFSQPFNQIGFSPTYKGVTAHLGYRSLRWGEYSLAGYNFLMGGLEAQVKNLRLGGVYGRLNRETRPDTTGPTANLQPSYKRMGYAAKLGYGKPTNYVDLVFLKAQDKGDSLPVSEYYKPVRPASNAVFNVITSQKFLKYFNLRGEVGFSSTNFDNLATGTPKYGNGLGLLELNSTGAAGTAYVANLSFQKKSFKAELESKQTTLDFKSFGGYQYNTNYSNQRIYIGYALAKGKLRITHLGQLMDDNLNKQKSVTTKRLLPGTTIDWQAGKKLGIMLQYNLVKSTQTLANAGSQGATLTPNLMNQMNHVVTFMPRLIFRSEQSQKMWMLMQTLQKNQDKNTNTKKYTENFTSFTNLTYNLVFIKTGFGINASVFNSYLENAALTMNTSGLNAGISKSFKKGLIQTGWNNSYATNKQQNTINSTLNISLRAKKYHNLTFNSGVVVSKPKNTSAGAFTEIQGRMMYVFTF